MGFFLIIIGVLCGAHAVSVWKANGSGELSERIKAVRIPALIAALLVVMGYAIFVNTSAAQPVAESATSSPAPSPDPSPSPEVTPAPTPKPTQDQSDLPIVGDEYTLKYAPLCVDDYHVFDAASDAEAKNDTEGAAQALEGHTVDVATGTRVRVLNDDLFRSDVDLRVTDTNSDAYGDEIYCMVRTNSDSQPLFGQLLKHA